MSILLPLFLQLAGRRVVLVGGGEVAAAKLRQLTVSGADVLVVAPEVCEDIRATGVAVLTRPFAAPDLDAAWLVVAAATPDVNRQVARAAESRRIFVNAVDDPAHATAFMGGVVRRGDVTVAVSTDGRAPALAGLLREALDALMPQEIAAWSEEARRVRAMWKDHGVPLAERRPALLQALNRLYGSCHPGSAE
jgi:uroporphyrin-III C-methyltransferase/precorrin-2 dehydrogenase/sirohydrochlorin ferrochelatase